MLLRSRIPGSIGSRAGKERHDRQNQDRQDSVLDLDGPAGADVNADKDGQIDGRGHGSK